MRRAEIEQRVADFKEMELYKSHVRINATPWWRQTERAATELRAVEARVEMFARSLGVADADDEPAPVLTTDEPTPEEPAPATAEEPAAPVIPGTKAT